MRNISISIKVLANIPHVLGNARLELGVHIAKECFRYRLRPPQRDLSALSFKVSHHQQGVACYITPIFATAERRYNLACDSRGSGAGNHIFISQNVGKLACGKFI